MRHAQEKLGNGVLIDDGDDQIVVLPPELRFGGTLVRIGRSGAGVYVEPLTPKPCSRANRRPKRTVKDKIRPDRA